MFRGVLIRSEMFWTVLEDSGTFTDILGCSEIFGGILRGLK